jgi:16S rRNA processing protein RimM
VAGRIVRPHGVRGEVVVEAESDVIGQVRPGQKVYLGVDRRPTRVTAVRPQQDRLLLSLEGCHSRPAAEELRGEEVRLRIDQVRLPEGVYFRWQLIGLRVLTEDGQPLGELVDVLGTGANDVYEIRLDDGRRVLVPAIDSVVREIDLPGGTIRVHLLPGLLGEG